MTNSQPASSKLFRHELDGEGFVDVGTDGYAVVFDTYGNACGIKMSEMLLIAHKYQQLQHGKRVEKRQEVNGTPDR